MNVAVMNMASKALLGFVGLSVLVSVAVAAVWGLLGPEDPSGPGGPIGWKAHS